MINKSDVIFILFSCDFIQAAAHAARPDAPSVHQAACAKRRRVTQAAVSEALLTSSVL